MTLKERFARFMQGRYGMDQLNRFLTGFVFALLVLNVFLKSSILNLLSLVLLIYLYVRMFSRNYSKRYGENQWFINKTKPIHKFFQTKRNHVALRKDYRLYKCPGCKQMVRVPKGKGKIAICCPKCGREFIRRS